MVPLQPSETVHFLTEKALLFNLKLTETPEPGLDTTDFEAHSSYVGEKNLQVCKVPCVDVP